MQPDNPSYKYGLAMAYQFAEHYPEAINTLKEMVAMQSGEYEDFKLEIYNSLAETQNLAELYEDALATTSIILDEFPDDSSALYEKATALNNLNQTEEAIAAYEESIKNDPLNFSAYDDLAATFLASGQTKSALEYATMAVALDDESESALETLAAALTKVGRTAEAADIQERIKDLHLMFDDPNGWDTDED